MAEVRLSDIIDPTIFAQRAQVLTEQKTNVLNSAAVSRSPQLDAFLAGGGSEVEVHSFKDLDDSDENISSDDPAVKSDSSKITAQTEAAKRLSRNKSWSTMDLARDISAMTEDPADAIANRVAAYWARRIQAVMMAQLKGVFAQNLANENDMILDISGSAYSAGVTNITTGAIVDAVTGMGTSQANLSSIVLHPVVKATLKKDKLVELIRDPSTDQEFERVLGLTVINDETVPFDTGVYSTYIVGANSVQWGMASPTTPVEFDRDAKAGNGGGMETLTNRVELCSHITGYTFSGVNNPSNAVLEDAASYSRVYDERKQLNLVELITRES